MKEHIDAALFRDIIFSASAALEQNRQLINELNVFPSPTATRARICPHHGRGRHGAREARLRLPSAPPPTARPGAMLRGARGNSGVILSLLFRGLAKKLKGLDTADSLVFAEAMTAGVDAATRPS